MSLSDKIRQNIQFEYLRIDDVRESVRRIKTILCQRNTGNEYKDACGDCIVCKEIDEEMGDKLS